MVYTDLELIWLSEVPLNDYNCVIINAQLTKTVTSDLKMVET